MPTIDLTASGVPAASVLVHTYAAEPRYRVANTLSGGQVVQLLGYRATKEVSILWDPDPASIEATVRTYETDGWVREGPINIQKAVNEMLGLYNATVRLVKFTASG